MHDPEHEQPDRPSKTRRKRDMEALQTASYKLAEKMYAGAQAGAAGADAAGAAGMDLRAMLDAALIERRPGYAEYVRSTPAFFPSLTPAAKAQRTTGD